MTRPTHLETVAERLLELVSKDGSIEPVMVRIGKPQRTADENWACTYQIMGETIERTRAIYGEDSMQALLLALSTIRAEMEAEARTTGRSLAWVGERDIGLPDANWLKGAANAA
jgi:hypothetical protein